RAARRPWRTLSTRCVRSPPGPLGSRSPRMPSQPTATGRTDMDETLRLAPGGSVRDEYVAFVVERHRIWERRALGLPAPWTDSPTLDRVNFTNNCRILERGSQYVPRVVQGAETPGDIVLRALLYRLTNLPVPW